MRSTNRLLLLLPLLRGFPLEFCNGGCDRRHSNDAPNRMSKVWRCVHSFRRRTGTGQTRQTELVKYRDTKLQTVARLTSCAGSSHNMPRPLQVDNIFVFIRQVAGLFWHFGYLRHQQQVDLWLLTLEVVSESHVTWATSVSILVFLGLSVLDLGPMYTRQTDVIRQTDVRRAPSLNAPYPRAGT